MAKRKFEDFKNAEEERQQPAKKVSNSDKKMISAYVNCDVYNAFTDINKRAGTSNNSILNMLISDYVKEKSK